MQAASFGLSTRERSSSNKHELRENIGLSGNQQLAIEFENEQLDSD